MTDIKDQLEQAVESANEEAALSQESSIAELQEALAAAQAKAEENWELALRTKADAENIKRRAEQDVSKAHKFALEKFVNELVPIVDSMELGLAAVQGEAPEIDKIREGSELTFKMMLSALEKFGVAQVNPEGEKFNPEFHQAMTMQESNEVDPNTVMNVIQKGYTLQGRLVRPAMVVVSKSATPPEQGKPIDETA